MPEKRKKSILQRRLAAVSTQSVPTFDGLVAAISTTHTNIAAQTAKAINIGLTLRNWLFGYYIHTYELHGEDRAGYGEKMFPQLAARLQTTGIKRVDERELRRYRQFFVTYPQIWESLTPEFLPYMPTATLEAIRASLTPKLPEPSKSAFLPINPTGAELLTHIPYTAFTELLQIADPLKRGFYEIETLRGGWSVRELKRQIASLLYERTGLSTSNRSISKWHEGITSV